ncbi:MAG: NUDIX domain-containing protein [Pseudomonadota bacterium]
MTELTTDITVSAIARKDDAFLCIDEVSSLGVVLNIPGGHIEAGETPEQAIVREVREETRWQFEPTGFVGAYLWLDQHRARRCMRLVFCGEALVEHADAPLDTGILAVNWCSREAIDSQKHRLRAPVVLNAIDDYLTGRREQLNLPPHDDTQSLLDELAPLAHKL